MSQNNYSLCDDKVYRVYIEPTTKHVHTVCLDIDSDKKQYYDSPDDLPEWMQAKVAVLMMTSLTKPTQVIEGVGRRIDANTYWVVETLSSAAN